MIDERGRYSRREVLQLSGRAVGLAAVGALATGCANAATQPPPTPVVDPVNLNPLKLTIDMIQFNTSHNGEGGVTLPHAEMLKAIWDAAGAQTEIIPTPKSDNAHFIARVPSTVGSAQPLLLLCHSDVVSVETDRWSVDPYRGEVREGWIYGRGALDMKGTNAAFMAALLRHLSEGTRFDRDIIFLSDCDEEAGPHGTRWLAEQHYDKIDAGVVITEGGWALAPPGSVEPMVVTLTRQDKMSAALELVVQGTTTHSSRPSPDATITRLNRAAVRLADYQPGVSLTDVTRPYFEAWASRTDANWGEVLSPRTSMRHTARGLGFKCVLPVRPTSITCWRVAGMSWGMPCPSRWPPRGESHVICWHRHCGSTSKKSRMRLGFNS